MTEKISEKVVRDGINQIFTSLLSESNNESKTEDLYRALITHPGYLKDPRTFYFAFTYKQKKVIHLALQNIKKVSAETISEYTNIFVNFTIYKAHIEKLCTKFEGSFGCADKSNSIIGRYLTYLRTGEKGDWESDNPECYWIPSFGSQDQWFELLHGIFLFQNGNSDDFFNAYNVLTLAGNEYKLSTES